MNLHGVWRAENGVSQSGALFWVLGIQKSLVIVPLSGQSQLQTNCKRNRLAVGMDQQRTALEWHPDLECVSFNILRDAVLEVT